MEEISTQLVEESIKRVVCIQESRVESDLSEQPTEEGNAADIKVVDVVNGKSQDVVCGVKVASELVVCEKSFLPEKRVVFEESDPPKATVKEEDAASDSDSEDDLQLIVNDEDIFYANGVEGVEEGAEGEEMFVAGDEHYEELDWAAEMHYHHSQFFKYVRPGSGPATTSPGVQDSAQGGTPGSAGSFTPGSMGSYGMGMWNYPFQPAYEFVLPLSKTIFDIDMEQFEDKPWDYPGIDISDYFNFGFNEETWKQYCQEFARVRGESSTKNKMRDDDNGQAWNYDNAGYMESMGHLETPRNRGQRGMRSGRTIHVEGGSSERRPSDLRRQRLRESGSVIQISGRHENHGEFRRKQRNEDPERRKGFSRPVSSAEQPSPLGGRLSRAPSGLPFGQTSPGGLYSGDMYSSGRPGMHISRSRMPSPGGVQSNGSRRLSSDISSRPWRSSANRNDEQYEDDDRSYGSSGSDSGESDRCESEEDIGFRNHRLKRFSKQPLESRLGSRAEPLREEKSAFEKRTVKLPTSRHVREEESKRIPSELPSTIKRLLPQKLERSSASAHVVTQKRSSELVTVRRAVQPVKRSDYDTAEAVSREVAKERKSEKASLPVSVKNAEPILVTEKKLQSISERRAQLVAEKRAERLMAEKRERLTAAENVDRLEKEKEPTKEVLEKKAVKVRATKTSVASRRSPAAVVPSIRSSAEVQERFVSKDKLVSKDRLASKDTVIPREGVTPQQQVITRRERPRSKQQDNPDLRLKVLEKVSARWKFQLRLDDAHAKKKRENMSRHKGREEDSTVANGSLEAAGSEADDYLEQVENEEVERSDDRRRKETREERKRRHKESRRHYEDEKGYDDLVDSDQGVDERWQMEDADKRGRKRKIREKERDEAYEDDWNSRDYAVEGSDPRQSLSSRRYDDDDDLVVEAWEMEEGECECEDDRWNVDDLHKRKKRRYNYDLYKDDELYADAETEDAGYNYDGLEEAKREYIYDGSTSSGQADEMYYRKREKSYSRDSDRWTGTLYDSGDEYDE